MRRLWPEFLGAVVVMLLFSTPLHSFAADTDNAPPDLRSIKAKGVLRVAITNFDIAPFHVRGPDGSYAGKDIQFARQLGEALKVRIVFDDTPTTFDGVVDAVASGRDDIGLSKLSQTYDRIAGVRFSAPYLTLPHALIYNRKVIAGLAKGGPPEVALRDFARKIGVIEASAYVDFATADYPKAQIVPFATWGATILALKDGKVDMVYRDEFEARTVLIQDPAIHVEYGVAVLSDRRSFLAMAVCDSCGKLEEFINYFIAQHPGAYDLDQLLTMHVTN